MPMKLLQNFSYNSDCTCFGFLVARVLLHTLCQPKPSICNAVVVIYKISLSKIAVHSNNSLDQFIQNLSCHLGKTRRQVATDMQVRCDKYE